MTLRLLLAIVLAVALVTLDQHAMSQSTAERYESLLIEYEAANVAWRARFESPTQESERVARYREYPAWTFAPSFVELARAAGSDATAFDALARVVRLDSSVDLADRELVTYYEQSLELLLQHHLANSQLRSLFRSVARGIVPCSERFLRRLMNESESREVRAEACFNLR